MAAGGSSWVVAFAGSKATNANARTLAETTDEGSSVTALNLATGRNISSWASRNYSATVGTAGNRTDAVEVLAEPEPTTEPSKAVRHSSTACAPTGSSPVSHDLHRRRAHPARPREADQQQPRHVRQPRRQRRRRHLPAAGLPLALGIGTADGARQLYETDLGLGIEQECRRRLVLVRADQAGRHLEIRCPPVRGRDESLDPRGARRSSQSDRNRQRRDHVSSITSSTKKTAPTSTPASRRSPSGTKPSRTRNWKKSPEISSGKGWLGKSPSALWLFNQKARTEGLVDLTGNGANEEGIAGTSVVAEEPPIPADQAAPAAGLSMVV